MEEVFIWSRRILLYGLAFLGLWHILGLSPLVVYFRALRRMLQSRSEPETPAFDGYVWMRHVNTHMTEKVPDCPHCNPQPTSQQPSAPTTGPPVGLSELSDANHPSTREPRAKPENAD